MKTIQLHDLERPRIGRRLSITPGPFPRPQRLWMEHLPWKVYAELNEECIDSMKYALGCQDETPEAEEAFEWFLNEMSEGRFLVRVVELSSSHRIPPGYTKRQMQARMDRWMPPGWEFDAEAMTLAWTGPTRFACPSRNYQVQPHSTSLLTSEVSYLKILTVIQSTNSVARWLCNGQVWVFYSYAQGLKI